MVQKNIVVFVLRGNTLNHVHFYSDLKKYLALNGIKCLIVRMDSPKVWAGRKLRHEEVISMPAMFVPLFIFFYTSIQSLFRSKITLHLKKVKYSRFFWLNKCFKSLRVTTDLEGDAIAEAEYLSNFDGLNSKTDLKESIVEESRVLPRFDKVFVQTNELKNLLLARHGNILVEKLITAHLLTSRAGSKVFSVAMRMQYRQQFGLENLVVLVYIGNIIYPWQNFDKSIEYFKGPFSEKYRDKAFFLVATREEDIDLAQKRLKSIKKCSLVINIPNDEIPALLSASDVGIVLRDSVKMNEVVYSGKFLEYLLCGLPVITTDIMKEKISDAILDSVIFIENPKSDILVDIPIDNRRRSVLSNRANDLLTIESLASEFLKYNTREIG